MTIREDSKNFFYDIEIISYDRKRRAVLTDQIKRLVESVEIQEVETTGNQDNQLTNSLNIVMREMSYLPEDGGLRPQAPDVFGQITNRPASIADLRFDTEKGYTFVSKAELESGTTRANRNQFGREEPIIFLLQANNIIRLTWGNLEPYNARTEEYQIRVISTQGGTSDHGRIQIQALSKELEFDKAYPDNGITFAVDPSNNIDPGEVGPFPLQPLSLKQTLFKVASAMGVKLIFDGNEVTKYPQGTNKFDLTREEQDDTAPADKPFRITSKMSYLEFVKELAQDFQSYTKVKLIEDEQYLVFNKTSLIFDDNNSLGTFKYKAEDNLVLGYSITDNTGSLDTTISGSSIDSERVRKKEQTVPERLVTSGENAPKTYNQDDNNKHQRELGKNRVGKSEAIPTEKEQKLNSHVDSQTYGRSYVIRLNLTTIGNPEYIPGSYTVENIGARYTGSYKMFGVKHVLNNSGYITQFEGKTQKVKEGGVSAKSQNKEKELETPEFTNEQLTQ